MSDAAPPLDTKSNSRRESLAAWFLSGPLSGALGLLCLWELITWAPNYLTWPLWADHDVFSTAARAWDAGVLPYRDLKGNNFPGTTYLFWILGKLFGFGWAQAPAFFAVDATLVALFGLVLVIWSRKRFAQRLPGLIGYGIFLGYYLNLDYSQAAQRDWQGPVLTVIGLMVVQAWTGLAGRASGGLISAAGLLIRPQAALLLPAQVIAVWAEAKQSGRSPFLAVITWGLALAIGLFLGFVPLLLAHLWPSFLASLRLVSYGQEYNMVTPWLFAEQFIHQIQPSRIDIVPIGILFLFGRAKAQTQRTALPWMIALVGVLLYRPISPHPHAYLTHPLMIVWTVLVAILVEMVLDQVSLPATFRLVAVFLIMGMGVTAKPRFCNPNGSLEARKLLKAGIEPAAKPTGYARNPEVVAAGHYEWDDYRNMLSYLRTTTSPKTKVANVLKYVPAITGPTGRVPAFPAESIAWLIVVHKDDEALFASALERAEDSVVVWDPSERGMAKAPTLVDLTATIERLYEFDKKFGVIEVWRRKPAK